MIEFAKIQRENIFGEEFNDFQENNVLEFGDKKVVVLYGPNGTGKTSLAKILKCDNGCEYSLSYEGRVYTNIDINLFHIIEDQNGRNLIVGETKDFLLGDDIRHEYDLKTQIDSAFEVLFKNILAEKLKTFYKIKKRNSVIIDYISDENIKSYTSNIANNRSKGSQIERNSFVEYVSNLEVLEIEEYDENKCEFLISELENNNSVISKIMVLRNDSIEQNSSVEKIERHSEAIRILSKFKNVEECIVCDGSLCVEDKLRDKAANREIIYNSLQQNTREILDALLKLVDESDPFSLKHKIINSINNGDWTLIEQVQNEITIYLDIISKRVTNLFVESLAETQLFSYMGEYNHLVASRPELTDEDIIFIENIVSDNIDKSIELQRDENNTLRLVLDGAEFLNKDRQELKLSNGEQNFISLAFELLKAKNVDKEIIVLDDPISSFDSIYKNKIAFSIIKFLESKKQIILTHNVELIRLIEHQKQDCFNLYIFNNTFNESNGFFSMSETEKELLLYMNKLVYLFRQNLSDKIEDEKQFLLSMIPFMRGYAQMICDDENKNKLTSLMHGYKDEAQNLVEIYLALFGNEMSFENEHIVNAQDIIAIDIDNIQIFKEGTEYKLLEKTLKHTLTYLYLRLSVEKVLVDKFAINTSRFQMLSQIIFKSFRGNDLAVKRKRIFLASKKTLLNEFNHFEGNMNIFQPAIDITNTALEKEKRDILQFLSEL
jgi:ABC-type lipoprotein export system ATPase subunit